MKEGRAGSTQASAAAHLRGAGNYNSWHASRRPPPSALLIGAESERVGWRGGSGRGCGAPIGESYGFCLPFTSQDDQGAPGARIFFGSCEGARAREAGSARARAWRSSPAARRSGARARRPVAGLCGARGTPEGRGSRRLPFVRRFRQFVLGCGTECGLCGVVFSLLLQLWGVWTEREPWTEGVSGAGQS